LELIPAIRSIPTYKTAVKTLFDKRAMPLLSGLGQSFFQPILIEKKSIIVWIMLF